MTTTQPKIWIIHLGNSEYLTSSFHAIISETTKELAISRAKQCFVNNINNLDDWESFDSLFNDLCHERSKYSNKSSISEYLQLSVNRMTDLPENLQDFYEPAIKNMLIKEMNDLDDDNFRVIKFNPTQQTSYSYINTKPL